jgi:hypothetical protein
LNKAILESKKVNMSSIINNKENQTKILYLLYCYQKNNSGEIQELEEFFRKKKEEKGF